MVIACWAYLWQFYGIFTMEKRAFQPREFLLGTSLLNQSRRFMAGAFVKTEAQHATLDGEIHCLNHSCPGYAPRVSCAIRVCLHSCPTYI